MRGAKSVGSLQLPYRRKAPLSLGSQTCLGENEIRKLCTFILLKGPGPGPDMNEVYSVCTDVDFSYLFGL